MSIRRFDPWKDRGGWQHLMEEGPEGRYVAFTDYEARLAEHAAEVAELRKHLDSAYDTLDYFGHSPPYDGSQARADKARITHLEAALTLLTNGMKYSAEVVTIAREALGASTETKGEQG